MSQVQGRTYANLFGVIERYINAKILELSRDHWFGDQRALEALVRFSDEELKHQELFRRIEALGRGGHAAGYRLVADGNAIASVVLGKSTWAVLALTCHIEIFTLVHYRKSIAAGTCRICGRTSSCTTGRKNRSTRSSTSSSGGADATLGPAERDRGVEDFIELVGAVDGVLQAQAQADSDYFIAST